ncbi:signal transduction histidine kinase [Mucilaginibacter pocheonensis]|uniref:Signal transduction histidine kinase n=2 Tax=Mucilaginibacter pocheonensis TaxID=398050 RepID=A0ABU1TAU4_9SPHI|nr:signal transduction histidine kinase [Mucilaginibacter pocheonensis]
MKEKDIHAEISSIRDLMERSAKFISLSGLSGVLAGIYALIGAGIGYNMLHNSSYEGKNVVSITQLLIVALAVLILSIGTAIWLSFKKAKKNGQQFWGTGSKRLLVNMAIPLVSGGLFTFILIYHGHYSIVAATTLIFYGMALVSGSHYTYSAVKSLGIIQILLGLLAAFVPGYGLIFWAIGFGLLHIIYGTIMYFKYDS